MAGGKTSSGATIYSSFSYDPGIAGSNWATWKFVNSLALDPLSTGTVFSSPPKMQAPLTANINDMLIAFSATDDKYKESGLAHMTPPGNDHPVNMGIAKNRGAKIMIYHGVSDAIFSAEDTRQWVQRVDTAQGGKGADFVRYFPVPGMNHCSGGMTTDQFDMLTPLVNWVEQGIAPTAVNATARGAGNTGGVNAELPKDWAANRTRPLCPYPQYAHYNGSGDIENAANFTCKP